MKCCVILLIFTVLAIGECRKKIGNPCERLEECLEKNKASKRTIKYCEKTGSNSENKEIPAKCYIYGLMCVQTLKMDVHKGECGICTKESICPKIMVEPSETQVGGRKAKKNTKRKNIRGGIWKKPICNENGEKVYETMCDFHVAKCQAMKDGDDVPKGSIRNCKPKRKSPCERLEECSKKNQGSGRTMKYCQETKDGGSETKEVSLRCMIYAMKCAKDQKIAVHKGECGICTKDSICPKFMVEPSENRVGGRKAKKNMKRKNIRGGIWKKPICDKNGEKIYKTMCDFHVAKCQAMKDGNDVPEGQMCKRRKRKGKKE